MNCLPNSDVNGYKLIKTLYGFMIQELNPESLNPQLLPKDIVLELRFDSLESYIERLSIGNSNYNNDHLYQLTVNATTILRELYSYGRGALIDYKKIDESISKAFENLAYVQCIQRKSGKTSAFCTKLVRECFVKVDNLDFKELSGLSRNLKALNKPQHIAKAMFVALCEGSLDVLSMSLCELKDITSNFDEFRRSTNRFYRDGNTILVNYNN